jgi:tetrapyrrole methylase family protein/MazG family protein
MGSNDWEKIRCQLSQQDSFSMDDLLNLVAFLRSESGCDWDRAQTHESLRKYLLEEAYEVCESIDLASSEGLREELGDLLLQIVFHADLEREKGQFNWDDVINGICKKMIERHPHLFSDASFAPDWDQVKMKTRNQSSPSQLLDSIPRTLPSLMRAQKLSSKLQKFGMEKMEKMEDETSMESTGNVIWTEEKVGKQLYELAKRCQQIGIDSEKALSDYCDRLVDQVHNEYS